MSQAKRHHYIDTIEQVLEHAVEQRIIQLSCDDRPLVNAEISIQGHEMVNFGSCSYLGLEQDARLKEGVIQAVTRYGTQFSSSRAYLSIGLYEELEQRLGQIFRSPVIATPSTSLGHQAALPVLVRDEDAIILDHQVHASVQNAVQLLKPRGIPVHYIRHNRLDQLAEVIEQLRGQHRHIWYLADGVYSMYGDTAPIDGLTQLLDRYEQLHLYIDDAHGMSWTGPHGCGFVRSHIAYHPRVMLAVSLNKAFAASGGALIFPSQEWARKVRTCGPTLMFSGPIQPPMLGAAIASADIHLSGAIEPMQQNLHNLLAFTRDCLKRYHLPLIADNLSPIFFVATGLPKVAYNLVGRLYQEGFYLNIGTFPATPMQRGGVRFTVTLHHTREQIEHLVAAMAYHYPLALRDEGILAEDVEQAFEPPVSLSELLQDARAAAQTEDQSLRIKVEERIDQLDTQEWDRLFHGRGPFSSHYLRMLESVFLRGEEPQNQWRFRYVMVRDQRGIPILATVLSVALMKDDLFAPAEVSAQIEAHRQQDPYWLTSTMLMAGTACGEGNPLYLRRDHPQWRQAMSALGDELRHYAEEVGASAIMLRDFDVPVDEQMVGELLNLGFVQITLPDRYVIERMNWRNDDEYLARLGGRYRYSLRKEALAYTHLFRVEVGKAVDESVIGCCYDLYHQVQRRGLALNTFPLPYALMQAYFEHQETDVIRLYLSEQPETLVAVMFSHCKDGVYSAGFVGLDYRYLESHKVYKQILYRTVERARELGCTELHLGFTAGLEKRKVGAEVRPTCAYALILDHFNLDIVESMTVSPIAKKRSTSGA